MILLPTDHNKLSLQWKGPFKIQGRIGKYDYVLDVKGKAKTFHANMLKPYISRDTVTISVIEEQDCEDDHTDLDVFDTNRLDSKETYLDVIYSASLTAEELQDAKNLVFRKREIFSDSPGTTNLAEHKIDLTTEEPVRQKPYPLPFSTREMVKEEVSKMLAAGIIERTESPYAAPIVLVRKRGRSIRFCAD